MDSQLSSLWKKVIIMGGISLLSGIVAFVLSSSKFISILWGCATFFLCLFVYGIFINITTKKFNILTPATVAQCEYVQKTDPRLKVTTQYFNVKFLINNNGFDTYCDYISVSYIKPGTTMNVYYNESDDSVVLKSNRGKAAYAYAGIAAIFAYALSAFAIYVNNNPDWLKNDSTLLYILGVIISVCMFAYGIYMLYLIIDYKKNTKTAQKVEAVVISESLPNISGTEKPNDCPQYEYCYNGQKYIYSSNATRSSKLRVGTHTYLYIGSDGIIYEPNKNHNYVAFFIIFTSMAIVVIGCVLYKLLS